MFAAVHGVLGRKRTAESRNGPQLGEQRRADTDAA